MNKLLDGDDETLAKLRKQFGASAVRSRDLTGAGFYTHFELNDESLRLVGRPSFHFGDVIANKGDGDDLLGFVLFVKDGFLDYLEGYTFGIEQWPEDLANYHLTYSNGENRDIVKLRTKWKDQ
ncbi:hypothetical protein [Sulfoacidibacillus ferrooxidans]|uniref:Uncharacterized protein n=1 Tax=Sulfoacidibacillus ferrooxidans TaxID=2005001 RepID=A0A9X1VAI5_9BACL|nr:hypothetical protein [Sulfoacidibacillus ferrooxidans]MCI0184656.1 hypothetical protein [Sulfoacidibacillus ferrooxidans]